MIEDVQSASLAPVGLIGAMEVEVESIKAQLKNREVLSISGIEFNRGELEGVPVIAAVCGIGKVFAAVCAQTMILRFGVRSIINAGVAGGLDPRLKLGDIAVATSFCQHDMDTSPIGDPVGLISGINKIYFEADPVLTQAAEKAASELKINWVAGTVASGDQFIADQIKKDSIQKTFGAIAAEMEGAPIAQVCYINSVPFAAIRAISDDASGNAPSSYESFFKEAAEHSIAMTKKIVSSLR